MPEFEESADALGISLALPLHNKNIARATPTEITSKALMKCFFSIFIRNLLVDSGMIWRRREINLESILGNCEL